jgi:hypothetical protein
MSDNTPEDYFGFNTEAEEAKKSPGLVTGSALRENELRAQEWMMRNSNRPEFAGSREVLFVEEDGLNVEEATKWQRLMDYPRWPTEPEIMAFKIYQAAKLERAFWVECRDAAARDDADEAAAAADRIDRQERSAARKTQSSTDADSRLGPVAPTPKRPYNAF